MCCSDPVEGSDLSLDHQVLLLVRGRVWAEQRLVAADHYVPELTASEDCPIMTIHWTINNIIGNDPQPSFSPLTEVADVRSLVICQSNKVVVGLQPSVERLVENQFAIWYNFQF